MDKQELKIYVEDLLLSEHTEIESLKLEECKYKKQQGIWNNLKRESKDLIESYVLANYCHIISGVILSTIYDKVNDYELKDNNDDYVDNKGNIKFTKHDTLNVNFDTVVDTIVEYEFMNK